MKKRITIVIVFLVINSLIFGQTKGNSTKQYEYLVYSFGKTYFDSITSNSRYYSLLLKGSESSTLTENLNKLGKLGWELIDVLGTIGGDQQVVFQRPIGFLTEEQEKDLITELEKEQQEKLLNFISEQQEEDEKKSAIPLIETDQRDWDIEYKQKNEIFFEELKRLSEIIKTYEGVIDVKLEDIDYDPKMYIQCDFTEQLLNENEYSLSQVKNLVSLYMRRIQNDVNFDSFVFYTHRVKTYFYVNLTYKGTSYEVYNEEDKIERSYK